MQKSKGINLKNLTSLIQEAVANEFKRSNLSFAKGETENGDEVMNRMQVCEYLQISLVTLWSITKEGLLPCKKIKSRVLYLKSDVLNYLNTAA